MQRIIAFLAQVSKYMLSRLNDLRILASLVSSYSGHDKNIKLLSDCFNVWSNKVRKWILSYLLHVIMVKRTNISNEYFYLIYFRYGDLVVLGWLCLCSMFFVMICVLYMQLCFVSVVSFILFENVSKVYRVLLLLITMWVELVIW